MFEQVARWVKKRALDFGIELPDDVLAYLANNIISNLYDLEGAIVSLLAQEKFNKKPITVDLAKTIINLY